MYTPEQRRRMQAFAEERESRIVAYSGSDAHKCFCGGEIAARIIDEPYVINEATGEWTAGADLCIKCIRLLAIRAGLTCSDLPH